MFLRGGDVYWTDANVLLRFLTGEPPELALRAARLLERTNSWHNAYKKLVWRIERRGRVIDFWVAFSDVVHHRKATHPRSLGPLQLEARPSRRPCPIGRSS